jgi:hypothetical protein
MLENRGERETNKDLQMIQRSPARFADPAEARVVYLVLYVMSV